LIEHERLNVYDEYIGSKLQCMFYATGAACGTDPMPRLLSPAMAIGYNPMVH
jgi:hypothetical protein